MVDLWEKKRLFVGLTWWLDGWRGYELSFLKNAAAGIARNDIVERLLWSAAQSHPAVSGILSSLPCIPHLLTRPDRRRRAPSRKKANSV